jgi:hypothetical protein
VNEKNSEEFAEHLFEYLGDTLTKVIFKIFIKHASYQINTVNNQTKNNSKDELFLV